MLLRLTLRKIALSDIESVDTKTPLWNEHWCTTLSLKRVVRIRRKSGWFRNFIITPPDRDAFIPELRSGSEALLSAESLWAGGRT